MIGAQAMRQRGVNTATTLMPHRVEIPDNLASETVMHEPRLAPPTKTSDRALHRRSRLLRTVLGIATIALVATACRYDPARFAHIPSLSECFGQQATIGIGWYGPDDGPSGSHYVGTEGDDVVVITNGPVSFDGLGGNDLICVNHTGLVSSTPPIVIDAGDGHDRVWDRRYRLDAPPATVVLDVELGDGDDAFYGSAANDVVDAGAGADEVNGGGGVDVIDCGPDVDLRWVGDHTDPATAATDCEDVEDGYGPVDQTAVQALLDDFLVDTYAFGVQLGAAGAGPA